MTLLAHTAPLPGMTPRGPCALCRRRGFVLPFVAVALAGGALLAMAFAGESLQALRAVKAARIGHDAGRHADEALSGALANWTTDSLYTAPLGTRHRRTLSVSGGPVTVEWQRLHPLLATVRAIVSDTTARRLDITSRDHLRSVWLTPVALPIYASVTTNAVLRGAEGTLISGSDVVTLGNACGLARDTASLPSVVARDVVADPAGSWPGAPIHAAIPATFDEEFRAAMPLLSTRVPELHWDATPRALMRPVGWHAQHIRGPSITLAGPTRWQGLIVVHGALTLQGTVNVKGLLVVDGPFDASRARLTVHGALVVADTSASGVMLGTESRLFYDRCAVQMALATAAAPSFSPLALWHRLVN
jgi:hypothetical protein